MSMIAIRQMQEENSDVNNLWKWPVECDKTSHNKGDIFEPQYMKWMTVAPPYINIGLNSSVKFEDRCKFGPDFVYGRNFNNAGYQPGLFLNFEPGTYDIEYDCDKNHILMLYSYAKYDMVKVIDDKVKYSFNVSGYHFKTQFKIDANERLLLVFRTLYKDEYTKFTNIKIR